jgi:hypothetical protein
MRHSLRAVSLSWLIVLVPILAGSPAGADGNGRVPNNDARPCDVPNCAAARARKAPIVKDDAAITAMDTSVPIDVTANDRRIAPKTVRIVRRPGNGTVGKPRNGTVTYTPKPGFSGQDKFIYRVKDKKRRVLSKKARVLVTVLPNAGPGANTGPGADAGPDRNTVTGLPVILNGSASFDLDGNTLGYSWRFLSVPSASARTSADIVNPASSAPSFTPDVGGNYELELTVTDGTLSDTDRVVITTAAPGQVPPNADAGSDIVVQLGSPAQTVTLNGSASDDPDDFPNPTLTFQWTFVSRPPESAVTNIAGATTATASFIPDVPGFYLLRLDVFDGENTDSDQVGVTVQPPPSSPDTTPPRIPENNGGGVGELQLPGPICPEGNQGGGPFLIVNPTDGGIPAGATVHAVNESKAEIGKTYPLDGRYATDFCSQNGVEGVRMLITDLLAPASSDNDPSGYNVKFYVRDTAGNESCAESIETNDGLCVGPNANDPQDRLLTISPATELSVVQQDGETTPSQTPTLTGTWRGSDPAGLSVSVNGVTYTVGSDPAIGLTTEGDSWSLTIALSPGQYPITASYEYVNRIEATGRITVTAPAPQ